MGFVAHAIGQAVVKQRRPLAEVQPVAEDLLEFFRSQDLTCELGGSIRRQAPTVGDIDIVIQCHSLDEIVLPDWIGYERCGPKAAHGVLEAADGEIGIDLWAARPYQWGAFLWYITGSKELNVLMRRHAISRGLKLSQFGVFRGDEKIDDGTERGVAAALGFPWIEPTDRQRYVTSQPIVGSEFEVLSSSGTTRYKVTEADGVWSCTCPHHTYRKAICKHIVSTQSSVAHL